MLTDRVYAQNETMSTKTHTPKPDRRDPLPDISMSAIRQYAHQIAEKFQPDKVILFGSFARGEQREGSDVDLLVVMPAKNVVSQAIRIRMAVPAPFAMDLIVRTPDYLRQRIAEGNWFLREITETGVVLHAKGNRGVDQKSRSGLVRSTEARRRKAAS